MRTNHTAEIFEILRRGQFICSNSPDEHIQSLYRILEDEDTFDELYHYFSKISYGLEKGDEFFYFSRLGIKQVELERKINQALSWIDLVDFFKTYDSSFDVGYRFTPSEVDIQLKNNADLKNKLSNLKQTGGSSISTIEKVCKAIDKMEREGYVKLESEESQTYKVLTSFNYLKDLMNSISIPEECANEIPE